MKLTYSIFYINDECLLIKQPKIHQARIIRVLHVMGITNVYENDCKIIEKREVGLEAE